MIGSLRGILISKNPLDVILEVGGVGYVVSVPTGTVSQLPPEGHEAFLHIHTHVREDAIQLFGFSTENEKRVFLTVLGISGIGPKLALNIISGISHDDFYKAVENEDAESLARIPGVGKKTSQRIVLELKGKLPKGAISRDTVYDDALSALVNLGYRKADAVSALDMAQKAGQSGLEGLIREALKKLTSGKDK